jgi:hypothetical protein
MWYLFDQLDLDGTRQRGRARMSTGQLHAGHPTSTSQCEQWQSGSQNQRRRPPPLSVSMNQLYGKRSNPATIILSGTLWLIIIGPTRTASHHLKVLHLCMCTSDSKAIINRHIISMIILNQQTVTRATYDTT